MHVYPWGSEQVRYMVDACEYSDYHCRLATLLMPYLSGVEHVCDVGCGLGYLSLELAKFVPRITAVEINREAADVLERNCKTLRVDNVHILCDDAFSMAESQQFDSMVFCIFGSVEEVLAIGKKHCKRELLMISRNEQHHRFSFEQNTRRKRKYSFENNCYELKKRGISFQSQEFALEFGQPFRSLQDAAHFYDLYSQNGVISGKDLKARLQSTARQDFPYYLPKESNLGLIRIFLE